MKNKNRLDLLAKSIVAKYVMIGAYFITGLAYAFEQFALSIIMVFIALISFIFMVVYEIIFVKKVIEDG